MVDATAITKFDRTTEELEELILFCVAVAGKTASVISKKVDQFLATERADVSPFAKIRSMARTHSLMLRLQQAKLGKYGILYETYLGLATSGIDLRTCSLEDLEKYRGIGPKTSRFFVLHTRPKQEIACLDTHVLNYLRGLGHSIPKGAPTGKRYLEIEKIFLTYAKSLGKTPADLDLAIWNEMSSRSGTGESIKSAMKMS